MKSLTAPARIENGKLILYERERFAESIKSWNDCEVELTVNYYSPRHSDEQREYYHACVVYNIQAALIERIGQNVSKADTHEWLKRRFNCIEFADAHGVVECFGKSTSRLTKHEFMDYIDKCISFAVDDLGIPFERFDTELYKKAKALAEKLGLKLKAKKRV